MPVQDPLRVTIVGGGIAGLATALALRRAGHVVHIYERSALNNEVGAAMHIPPNATRALLAWGLDPTRAKMVKVKASFRAKASTLEKFHVGTTESSIPHAYGAPWFFVHRVDFHDELKRLAMGSDGVGLPATIHLKSKVVGYDTEGPSITLSDGSIVRSDVVIGADGIHSTAVEAILGRVNEPVPSKDLYNFCYRFLISAADIEKDPETRFWNLNDDGQMKFFSNTVSNEIHNFIGLFHQDDLSMMKEEDWQASVDKSTLMERFSDLHPKLKAVIDKATDVKQWALLYREPLPTWTKGRLGLAGDACHPMLPHQGQGGAQGIEDSVVLGLAFCGAEKQHVQTRLRLYEQIRRNRASLAQVFSNAGQDEPELIQMEASKYIPLEEVPKTPEEFFDYNFGYDVIRDTLNHLKRLDPAFELPGSFFQNEPGKGVYPKEVLYEAPLVQLNDTNRTT
ncbi:hypothetical protein TruAng_004955 [Truncatella angustata]|nr:hypothetical protein TruAng_004955 [Truncatella angustata]